MKKELRTFEIRFQDSIATISTDRTRIGTLEALIKMIFHEFHRKKPEDFDKFMIRLNLLHQFTKQREKDIHVEPMNDFDFWKGLMEKPPLKGGDNNEQT
ncbi:hypothetical protein ACXFAU_04700 [Paenibacillus glucanolyticus]